MAAVSLGGFVMTFFRGRKKEKRVSLRMGKLTFFLFPKKLKKSLRPYRFLKTYKVLGHCLFFRTRYHHMPYRHSIGYNHR